MARVELELPENPGNENAVSPRKGRSAGRPVRHNAQHEGSDMHFGNMSFGNFLLDILFIFFFVVWFWMIITVMMDLFRRHDVSGFAKVIWVIFLVVLPYLGVFAYLVTQSGGMADRNAAQADQAREHLRSVVGYSVADEIEKLDRLKAAGSLSETEYKALRAKLF